MIALTDICRKARKDKTAVSHFLARHGIAPIHVMGRFKYYDEESEPLASYIGAKTGDACEGAAEPAAAEAAVRGEKRGANKRVPRRAGSKTPLNDLFSRMSKDAASPAAVMLAQAYQAAKDEGNYRELANIAIQLAKEEERARGEEREMARFKAMERIKEAEAKARETANDVRRGELVWRGAVAAVWDRMCAIVTSQFHSVGIKIAPQVCAELGVTGSAAALKAQGVIDNEVFLVSENIKRELMDFLETM